MRRWRSTWLAVVFLGGVCSAAVALAQNPTEPLTTSGFYVTPSFSLAELYDDNIFSRASGRKNDFISRFTPSVQAGYRSAPLTLLGSYGFDAEVYANHPELTDAQERQHAAIDVQYLPTHLLTLSLNGGYNLTHTPTELNLLTGLEVGRRLAQRFSFAPSAKYQLDPLMSTTWGYTFERDTLSGGVSTDTHLATLGLERQLTRQDVGDLQYSFRDFRFSPPTGVSGPERTITAHAFTIGWTRHLTPLTSVTLRGGPRFSEGSVDPEVSASIRHILQHGALAFTYARAQNTSIGLANTVATESFSASISYDLSRSLTLTAEPSFSRNRFSGDTSTSNETKGYSLHVGATYQIVEWLSLIGSYQFAFQQGVLGSGPGSPGAPDQDILHNIVLLSLVATHPYRVH